MLALASQKNFVSFYVTAYEDNENIINKYRNEFNKSVMKKSCLSFSNMKQVNTEALRKIIIEAVKNYKEKNN